MVFSSRSTFCLPLGTFWLVATSMRHLLMPPVRSLYGVKSIFSEYSHALLAVLKRRYAVANVIGMCFASGSIPGS